MLFNPLTCALVSTIVISVWHAPFLYEWTLQDKLVHVGEHLMFLAVSLRTGGRSRAPPCTTLRPATPCA